MFWRTLITSSQQVAATTPIIPKLGNLDSYCPTLCGDDRIVNASRIKHLEGRDERAATPQMGRDQRELVLGSAQSREMGFDFVEMYYVGRALLKRSVDIFDELRQSVREIEFLSDPNAGELRFGPKRDVNSLEGSESNIRSLRRR